MCTKRAAMVAGVAVCVAVLAGCGGSQRTGTAFCAQLGKEIPQIAQRPQTTDDIKAMVNRYERLLERSPLTIEKDFAVLTDLLRMAEKVNTNDTQQVQDLADATYAANQSALNVRDWVKSTCAVDISTGLNIEPPRQAPTTTVAGTTTVAP